MLLRKEGPIAKARMEINDQFFFVITKEATFQVGAEVVSPTEAAALATAAKSGEFWDGSPTALAIGEDEGDQFPILLCCPRPLLYP